MEDEEKNIDGISSSSGITEAKNRQEILRMDSARIILFFVGIFIVGISLIFASFINSLLSLLPKPFGLKPAIFLCIAGLIMIGSCWISRKYEDVVRDDDPLRDSIHKNNG